MINLLNLKKDDSVLFLPDVQALGRKNAVYKVEDVESDVAYLIDKDGSSFTAIAEEMEEVNQVNRLTVVGGDSNE
jgi:hypothetical protein